MSSGRIGTPVHFEETKASRKRKARRRRAEARQWQAQAGEVNSYTLTPEELEERLSRSEG